MPSTGSTTAASRSAGTPTPGRGGISRVEASIDGGTNWSAEGLSEPLADPDTWRQWTFEWESDADGYEVVVRGVDGEGFLQVREVAPAFPSGATGSVSRAVRP